jgi:hypothetical protein
VFGLVSATTPDVSYHKPTQFQVSCHVLTISHASSASSENGDTVRDARRLWYFPRFGGQGSWNYELELCLIDDAMQQSLFAYHMEALVPSSPQSAHTSQTPQKLNGTKDVHFFCVGTLHSRTLVIYMKKKHVSPMIQYLLLHPD